MLEFLQKFNNLPIELREKVSAPAIMRSIGEIEKKYGLSLATLIMKVMVKDIIMDDLEKYFVFEHDITAGQAKELAFELKKKIFFDVSDYLGFDKNDIREENLENWMQDRKESTAVREARFYFSPEDEEEVKDLAKKLAGYNPSLLADDSSEDKALEIIRQLNISFSSSDLLNRFKQILKTYIKGIRRKIDTREVLLKTIAYGGMEMSDEMAEKILKCADMVMASPPSGQAVKQPVKITVPEDALAASLPKYEQPNEKAANLIRDVDYDFGKLAALPKKDPAEPAVLPAGEVVDAPLSAKETPAIQSSPVTVEEEKDRQKNLNYEEIIFKAKRIAQEANANVNIEPSADAKTLINREKPDDDRLNIINARRPKNIDGKIRMDDVKYVPKLTGPLDELREMDLMNFRRMNNEPGKAADKIKEKIYFLEDESYSQRLKGIKSWRQSPINKLYLEIGEESITNKKPINIIIDERKTSGREYITSEEFTAIMELNKDLRY